jgi:hypothetical protein
LRVFERPAAPFAAAGADELGFEYFGQFVPAVETVPGGLFGELHGPPLALVRHG